MTTHDIARMSVEERLHLMADLWDSLASDEVLLTPEQEAELARRMTARDLAHDDLAWAKPFIDEAVADVERGDVIPLDEHEARMNALMDKLEGR